MNNRRPEPVAVKTNEFGRPVAFVRYNGDSPDGEIVVIDAWATYWAERDAEVEIWSVVGTRGTSYVLHHQAHEHNEVKGQGYEGIWMVTSR